MNKPLMFDDLMKILLRHEGIRLKPYKCSAGKLTIGVGRNLEDQGISKIEALAMLVSDIEIVHEEALKSVSSYKTLNDARKIVVASMIFNMGIGRFLKFTKFLRALNYGDFQTAAKEMMDSLWSTQVGERAKELSDIMATGQLIDERLN